MKALMRPGGGELTPSEGDQVAHIHDSIFVVYYLFLIYYYYFFLLSLRLVNMFTVFVILDQILKFKVLCNTRPGFESQISFVSQTRVES